VSARSPLTPDCTRSVTQTTGTRSVTQSTENAPVNESPLGGTERGRPVACTWSSQRPLSDGRAVSSGAKRPKSWKIGDFPDVANLRFATARRSLSPTVQRGRGYVAERPSREHSECDLGSRSPHSEASRTVCRWRPGGGFPSPVNDGSFDSVGNLGAKRPDRGFRKPHPFGRAVSSRRYAFKTNEKISFSNEYTIETYKILSKGELTEVTR
jgi:hypothetical protein